MKLQTTRYNKDHMPYLLAVFVSKLNKNMKKPHAPTARKLSSRITNYIINISCHFRWNVNVFVLHPLRLGVDFNAETRSLQPKTLVTPAITLCKLDISHGQHS